MISFVMAIRKVWYVLIRRSENHVQGELLNLGIYCTGDRSSKAKYVTRPSVISERVHCSPERT